VTSTMAATDAGRRRLLVMVSIGVAVLLAALVLPRVLLGGGGDGDEEAAAPTTTVEPGAAEDVGEAVDELEALPSASFSTKNPFTPLVAIGATTAPTDTGSTTDELADTGAVPSDLTGTTGGTTGTTGTTGTGGVEPDRAAVRLSIVDIYAGADGAPVATVEVDGSLFTVREGEAFGNGYQVVSLSLSSRTGVFSREGQQFTVREGEAQLK
jgi:hypothetical protein